MIEVPDDYKDLFPIDKKYYLYLSNQFNPKS